MLGIEKLRLSRHVGWPMEGEGGSAVTRGDGRRSALFLPLFELRYQI